MTTPLALVTGGTSGIGRATAEALGERHDLALAYGWRHDRAEAARDSLRRRFPDRSVEIFARPLAGHADCAALVDEVRGRLGTEPSVLVHCAGRIDDELFLTSAFERQLERIHEHLVVAMALAHLCLEAMYRGRFGRIVNLSSIAARFARRGQCGYSAAKAGIEGFTRALAIEVAHRGVTVNAVAPGLIETPMTEEVVERIAERGVRLRAHVPAGRLGRPREVASLIRYLCSDEAAYVTGSVFTVDGGRSLGDSSS